MRGDSSPDHLRASHLDREHVIGALKTAFVQGRLAKDEFDSRVGQALASRTHAELAAIIAHIPVAPIGGNAEAARPVLGVKSGVGVTAAAVLLAATLWVVAWSAGVPRRERRRSRLPASSSSPCS